MATISSLSLEHIRVKVEAIVAGVPKDPTGAAPEWSLEDFDTDPEPTTWQQGTWETWTDQGEDVYYALLLVGPGGQLTPTDGKYHVWLKVLASPETPIRKVGVLDVQ